MNDLLFSNANNSLFATSIKLYGIAANIIILQASTPNKQSGKIFSTINSIEKKATITRPTETTRTQICDLINSEYKFENDLPSPRKQENFGNVILAMLFGRIENLEIKIIDNRKYPTS